MDWLLRYADRIFALPSPGVLEQYLGPRDACFWGYAAAQTTRARAASGGVVSALLIDLLEHGEIQGALVSRVRIANGRIEAHPFIARTPAQILEAQSSIYMEFPWLREARPLLRTVKGRVAVVGLPCGITALHRLERRDPSLRAKIAVHIALICGRSSLKKLLLEILARKGIYEDDVANIRFREGHWRGKMHLWLHDGSEVSFPFEEFGLYRNLHFDCHIRCLFCDDPLGERADVVCGDVWLHELKDQPIKYSLVISRSPWTTKWLKTMKKREILVLEEIPPETVFRAQRRNLILAKRGKLAKARLARFFGYRIRHKTSWRSHWNDYLAAAMVLLNYRWAASRRWRWLIFRLPRSVLKLYLIIISFLKNF